MTQGWIERYTWLAHQRSPMAPEIFHQTVAMHCVSSVLGRSVYFERGAKTIYPNVWSVLLGPAGTSKKSTALDYGRAMLQECAKELQMADCGSLEGLVAELAEQSRDGKCHVWTNQDEFARMVSGMKRKDYLSDMKDVFMQLYDGKPLSRRLVKTDYRVDPVYMSFMSASTVTRLSGVLDAEDLGDGFLSRFLIVYATDNGYVDDGRPDPTWTKARQDLEHDLTQIRTAYATYPTEMIWSNDAHHYFSAWKADLDSHVRERQFPPSCAARMEDYFIKMAMLWEVSDRCGYLGQTHTIGIERVLDISEKITPYLDSMQLMFERLGTNPKVGLVHTLIVEAGATGILYRDLLRQSKLGVKKTKECLETLLAQEMICWAIEPHPKTPGAERKRYYPRADEQ